MFNPHIWRDWKLPPRVSQTLNAIEIAIPAIATIIAFQLARTQGAAGPTLKLGPVTVPHQVLTLALSAILVAAVVATRVSSFVYTPLKPFIESVLEVYGYEFWDSTIESNCRPASGSNITLYECCRKRGIFLAWAVLRHKTTLHLVPRLRMPRSGERPNRTYDVWLTKKPNKKSEGFPGRVFEQERMLVMTGLPDIAQPGADRAAFENYARQTNDNAKSLRRHSPTARTLAGAPVYSASGARWGVLVFESDEENAIDTRKLTDNSGNREIPLTKLLQSVLDGRQA